VWFVFFQHKHRLIHVKFETTKIKLGLAVLHIYLVKTLHVFVPRKKEIKPFILL
jgi:hypothetical protein